MSVGVTGASGRLGRATLQELLSRLSADEVIAIARDPARVDIPDIKVLQGDYAAPDSLRAAFAGLDTLIFVSAPVTPGIDRLALHRNVVDAAVAAGVRKVIYTSVIGTELAMGTYFEPFYLTNKETEDYLQASGLEWVVARNGMYLDLDVHHIKLAGARDGIYRNNAGEGRCGYICIAELACALAELAVHDNCDGMAVNLFGELYTQAELVALVNEAYGLDVRYEAITVDENVARMLQDERIAARGQAVAEMLSGCFQCMERGAYELMSHFRRAAGRDAKSIPEQLASLG